MKKMLIPLLGAALLLGGCGGTGALSSLAREAEELQPVQTLGYDRAGAFTTVSAAAGRGTESMPAQQLRGTGRSIVDAIENMQEYSPRETLFFAHTRFVLVGEEAAREGLAPLLDWFERSTQTRLTLPVFLVEGGTAEKLICGGGAEDDVSQALFSLQREAERLGWAKCFTLCDMARGLADRGCALCCSVRAEEEGDRLMPMCTGFALFRDGRLLCLSGEETARGVCLLLNCAAEGTVTLPREVGAVTLELLGGDTAFHPHWREDGTPEVRVELRYRAGILEDAAEAPELSELDRAFSRWLEQRAGAAMELLCGAAADFADLGRRLERSDPARFAALDWERTLPLLDWTVEARGVVERSYDVNEPGELAGREQEHE